MTFTEGHALIIGVSSHQFHGEIDIPISVSDAKAVAEILQDRDACGYLPDQIHLLYGDTASKQGILNALDQLAAKTTAKSTVFFFYCGHGSLGTDGNYYLVSHDVRLQDGRVKAGTGVSEAELLDKLRLIKAERVLMLIDACYSGNLSPSRGHQDASRDLRLINPPEESAMALLGTGSGRILITSCLENQVSYIGRGEISIFTQALVDGLRGKGVPNNNGMISAFSLYEQLYAEVAEMVQEQVQAVQQPELTVTKGVGPFAVALYKGARSLGDFVPEPVPQGPAVRKVSPEKSAKYFNQRVIHTGGGAYVGGSVQVKEGDFVGRDKTVQGDEIRGDKVGGDQSNIGVIQGSQAVAIGRGAHAEVNQGVSGTVLAQLFAPLMQVVQQSTPPAQRQEAEQKAQALQAEVAKGKQANDSFMASLIEDLIDLVPGAVSTVLGIFATSLLSGIAGVVTKHVLDRLQRKTGQ